jgi:hypothetical protein
MAMFSGSPTDKDAESQGEWPEHPETVVGLNTGPIGMFSDDVRVRPPIEVVVISDKNQSDESMRRQATSSQVMDLGEESKR